MNNHEINSLLISVDDNIFNIIQKELLNLSIIANQSKYKQTATTLCFFIPRLGFIKNSIFDLADNNDIYSMKILFRSMIEHYFRVLYISLRFGELSDDSIGNDYLIFCDLDETYKYIKSLKNTIEYFDINGIPDSEIIDFISTHIPNIKKYSWNEIKPKVSGFSFGQIIKYLIKTKKMRTDFLFDILPIYSSLCSFVHGGPQAINNVFSTIDTLELENEKIKIKRFALLLYAHSVSIILLFFYKISNNKNFFMITSRYVI